MGLVVTLFEHELSSGFDWTEKDFVILDRLNRVAGAELLRPTLRGSKRELLATQHVGVFRLGKRTVQVLPKIYATPNGRVDDRQRVREATRNLLHLLQIAGDVPLYEQGLACLLGQDMDWFEILTYLFATHLREEWLRGASRGYLLVEDDQPALKGKWRIADQFRRPARDHIFSVAYDEFTADIPLNRVFRFVVERLWNATRDSENRHVLGELREWLEDVTLLTSLTASAASPALLTRLNRRLEPLLNLARLFLDSSIMQLAAGDLSAFAFVFDMNRVFEAFVVNLVRRYRREVLPPHLWDCELLLQARGASLFMARFEGNPVFRLKPDLVLRSGSDFPLILDAKYKGLEPETSGVGITHADFNQMYAYGNRYACPRVLMLYPQTANMPKAIRREFTLVLLR